MNAKPFLPRPILMSNHPQLELFFTNAIWSNSQFIQSFSRVLLTLRISPSDDNSLPLTLDLDPPTANFLSTRQRSDAKNLDRKVGGFSLRTPNADWRMDWNGCGEFLEEDVTGHNAHPSGALAAGMACGDWVTWLLADLLALASRRISSHPTPVA